MWCTTMMCLLVLIANQGSAFDEEGEGGGQWVIVGRGCKTWWACNIKKSKSNNFINMNISNCLYQCYWLSSHFTIHYYFIFSQKCKRVLYFLHLLGYNPLSKVHVSDNRSNTDYDPQDILLHCRMINKTG